MERRWELVVLVSLLSWVAIVEATEPESPANVAVDPAGGSQQNDMPPTESSDGNSTEEVDGFLTPNVPIKTLGGRQLWGDELVFHDWRIQKHCLTGHYRLLDDRDVRQQWGTWQVCFDRWVELKREKSLPPLGKRVVLVLHGLGRTRQSMQSMVDALRADDTFEVMAIGYPSTRQSIAEHAEGLARVVENLGPDVEEINFVAHSLGNLVIRQYLHTRQQNQVAGKRDVPLGRIVMLGPPNQDASITRILGDSRLFEWAVQETGTQLAEELPRLSAQWGAPPCEVAVIAGGKGDQSGWNPLLPGDDDGIVRVSETRLPGAREFHLVPVLHTFLMDDPAVQRLTLRFLLHQQPTAAGQPGPRSLESATPPRGTEADDR